MTNCIKRSKPALYVALILYVFYLLKSTEFDIFFPEEASETQPSSSTPPLTDSNDNIFVFSQITDIHVSAFSKGFGRSNLEKYVIHVLPFIRPEFVAVTGDLTDAKAADGIGSGQVLSEWKIYQEFVSGYVKTDWLDLRGNHDCFHVSQINGPNNHFNRFSQQKKYGYMKKYSKSFGEFTVIALDGCPIVGTGRLFNFFGILEDDDMEDLQRNLEKASNSDHIIVINHYPLSTLMTSPNNSKHADFISMSKKFSLYLSGHLHDFGGIGKIYANHANGFLELVLDDMKLLGSHRVGVIDHGLISFRDVNVNDEVIIVITNPKDARFLLPSKEPIDKIANSTHIRVLVFSPFPVILVKISLNESPLLTAVKKGDNLWTCPWNPNDYGTGIHHISVVATNEKGTTAKYGQIFSVDKTISPITDWGNKLLTVPIMLLIKFLFWASYLTCLCFIAIPRLFGTYLKGKGCYFSWLQNYQLYLAQVDTTKSWNPISMIFLPWRYALQCFWLQSVRIVMESGKSHLALPPLLYLLVGPWFFGPFSVDSPYLISFYIYGLFSNTWIRVFDTWVFAWIHLALGWLTYLSFLPFSFDLRSRFPKTALLSITIWLVYWVGCIYRIFTIYGLIPVIVSPGLTWSFLYQLIIWYWYRSIVNPRQKIN